MFDRFGEFDSAEEINTTAVNLRREGDTDSLRVLAEENGIDGDVVQAFLDGDIIYLCDGVTAAAGKLEVESRSIDCAEIMEDWLEYIKAGCFEEPALAAAVRRKGKSLKECIAGILKWSFKNQHKVDEEIMKAAGVSAGKCTLGIPGAATAKRLIKEYYLGKAGMRN